MKKSFTKYGSKFKLLTSLGRKALYERKFKSKEAKTQWEVHVMYQDKNGKLHHPGSSMWGGEVPAGKSAKGWTFLSYAKAVQHYDSIQDKGIVG